MVNIVRDGIVKIVPRSSYDNFFKSQGWNLEGDVISPSEPYPVSDVEEDVVTPVEESSTESEEEVNDEDWDDVMDELIDEEVEKPISEMNKEELTAKAKKLGINTANLTNKQLREAIKSSSK